MRDRMIRHTTILKELGIGEAAEVTAQKRGLPGWVGSVVEKLVLWVLIGEARKVKAIYDYLVNNERPSDIAAKYGTDPKTFRRSWLRRLEEAVPLPTGVKYIALRNVVARATPRILEIGAVFEDGWCACGRFVGKSAIAKTAHLTHMHKNLLIDYVAQILNTTF